MRQTVMSRRRGPVARWISALSGVAITAVLAGCGAADSAPSAGREADTTPASSVAPSDSKAPEAGPIEAYPPDQGGAAWLVALKVVRGPLDQGYDPVDDPELDASAEDLAEHTEGDYTAVYASVECDTGARRELNLKQGIHYWYTAAYFASERMAWRFVETYSLKPVGVVKIELIPSCGRKEPK